MGMQTNNGNFQTGIAERMLRGMRIVETVRIKVDEKKIGHYLIQSESKVGTTYSVNLSNEIWTCSCPDFSQRGETIGLCKHMVAVLLWIDNSAVKQLGRHIA